MLRKHGRHLLVVPCRAGLAVLVCGILCLPPSCAWATIEAKTADVVLGQAGFTVSVQAITATAVDLENGEARFDASGNVWVVDAYNKRVLRYSKPLSNGKAADLVFGDTTFTTSNPICTFLASPGADKMCGPWGLAFDSSGNVWVSDDFDHRILRFSAPFSNGMSADLVLGQTDLLSKVVLVVDASHMKTPEGLAFESTGDIWVADTGNHRVLRFPKGAGFTNGGTADKVIGQANFTSGSANQGGAVSALSLASPSGVAFDGSGNLWVVDKGNNRVLRFPKGGGFTDGMAADLVLGQADFVSGAPATTATRLKAPGGIAFDLSGNLWVGDSSLGGNNRVLRYSKPFSTGMAADLVLGQLTFTLNAANGGGTPDARTLFGSAVTAFDGSGNLLVREGSNYPGISEGNNRVLVFNPATTPPGPNPNPDCTPAVYPNPVHPSKGETSVTVTCVPAGASVRLYTVAGEEIKVVTADANGHATWNISNAMGTNVVTGVYYALILHEGHKHTVTLAVER